MINLFIEYVVLTPFAFFYCALLYNKINNETFKKNNERVNVTLVVWLLTKSLMSPDYNLNFPIPLAHYSGADSNKISGAP